MLLPFNFSPESCCVVLGDFCGQGRCGRKGVRPLRHVFFGFPAPAAVCPAAIAPFAGPRQGAIDTSPMVGSLFVRPGRAPGVPLGGGDRGISGKVRILSIPMSSRSLVPMEARFPNLKKV